MHALRLSVHVGVGGVKSPGRAHDPEGARKIVISFKTSTCGVVVVVIRHKFPLVRHMGSQSGRVRMDANYSTGAKKTPVYIATRRC